MSALLAVDVGLRCGLACFAQDGRLIWYRSQHIGNRTRLRKAAMGLLTDRPQVTHLLLEGGGELAQIWQTQAVRRGILAQIVSAEVWRADLLYPREQRDGVQAKAHADALARQVIVWSGAPRPTSLRHDAAEAILVGLWGVWQLGWLTELPPALQQRVS